MCRKQVRKILLAMDFDHTIIDDNSDTFVQKLLPNGVPDNLKHLYRNDNWTKYMAEIFKLLHEIGVKKDTILNCMEKIRLTEGMKSLFEDIPKEQTEIIIISDSNSIFINHILSFYNLRNYIKEIFTNFSAFENDLLTIKMYHNNQRFCNLSTINLCKGDILEKYVSKRAGEGIFFSKIAYIGDGYNDFCPSYRLNTCDAVFPRENYSLINTITKMSEKGLLLNAGVYPWKSGEDILKIVKDWYNVNLSIPEPRLCNAINGVFEEDF